MDTKLKMSLVALTLVGLALPGDGLAKRTVSSKRTLRPLSDFLDRQGSMSVFFPPAPDQVGWADRELTTFAVVDYSGAIAEWIKSASNHRIATRTTGTVTQIERDDGRADIIVELHTSRALMFAQSVDELASNDFDFAKTPTIFGATPLCVVDPDRPECDGAELVTGSSSLYLAFTVSEPGAELPDLVDLVGNYDDSPGPGPFAPVAFYFEAEARDKDGQVLYIYHTVSSSEECVEASSSEECELEFQLEVVQVE